MKPVVKVIAEATHSEYNAELSTDHRVVVWTDEDEREHFTISFTREGIEIRYSGFDRAVIKANSSNVFYIDTEERKF